MNAQIMLHLKILVHTIYMNTSINNLNDCMVQRLLAVEQCHENYYDTMGTHTAALRNHKNYDFKSQQTDPTWLGIVD